MLASEVRRWRETAAAETFEVDWVSQHNVTARTGVPFVQALAGRKDGVYVEVHGTKLTIGFFEGRFFFDEEGTEVEERSAMDWQPKHSREFDTAEECSKALCGFSAKAWEAVADVAFPFC